MKFFKAVFVLSCICLNFSHNLYAQEHKTYASLIEALSASSILRGKSGPASLNWIDKGSRMSYIKEKNIYTEDPVTGKEEKIFSPEGHTLPGSDTGFTYESFQWSKDSKHLVFQSNFRPIYRHSGISDFYIYDLNSNKLKVAAKNARSAELSPDGKMVGMERSGNLYVYTLENAKEKELTTDSTSEQGVFNGHYDWVYEEEFGQTQAWNWSPDSKYIAFWQFNEHQVPVFKMTNYEGTHPVDVSIPIPQPGDANPSVKIGVANVQTGKKIWLQPEETGDFYIPRIYWTSNPDELAVMTLNRAQNHMKLYLFNVKTGTHKVILDEQNSTWVAVFNFYTDVNDMIYFPENTKEFFWVSDRSGFYHIYRYNYNGKLINQVTKGNWDLIKVSGIDPLKKVIYYLSTEASPLEKQFYSINFDGTNKHKLSTSTGFHDINMSPNTHYYIDSYSNTTSPLQVSLDSSNGNVIKLLEKNSDSKKFIALFKYSPLELFSFKTSDGQLIDGSMIKPFNFDSNKKYPVVFTIYGGPESHIVNNEFSWDGWMQWLAQNGYLVVNINNRGSANYGRKFMKIVYKQLGKWESNDFVEAAAYLGTLTYVDTKSMAITGTSYGGYCTTFTLLTHPGIFKVGIANSPVTDWRLYDDIYTERYMAPLKENTEGYIQSADMTHAQNLKDHLLLIHSMSDDNVHPANTMQLLSALTDAGKDADLRIYPKGAHGAAYNMESYLLIKTVSFNFLERYLKSNSDSKY